MENVTEELVRQNGNQAAAVMADYAGQGGGSTGFPYNQPPKPSALRNPTEEDAAKLPPGNEAGQNMALTRVMDLVNGEVPYQILFDTSGEITIVSLLSVSDEDVPEKASLCVVYGSSPLNGWVGMVSSDGALLGLYEAQVIPG